MAVLKTVEFDEYNERIEREVTSEWYYANEYGEPKEDSPFIFYNGLIFAAAQHDNDVVKIRLSDWRKPKKRRLAKSTTPKTYVLLTEAIADATEKAIAVVTGTNGCITRGQRKTHYTWIAKSQTAESNGKLYIAAFIASQLPTYMVDFSKKISI
jgi:hypothetical protein